MRVYAAVADAHKLVFFDISTTSQDALAKPRALLAKPRACSESSVEADFEVRGF